jgi:N-acetylmuramoyl-L-alanine amidase
LIKKTSIAKQNFYLLNFSFIINVAGKPVKKKLKKGLISMKKFIKKIMVGSCALAMATSSVIGTIPICASAATSSSSVRILSPKTSKISNSVIRVSWGDSKDASVKTYKIYRRATKTDSEYAITSSGSWTLVKTVASDGKVDNVKNYIDDNVGTKKAIYEYRVDVIDKSGLTGKGNSVYGSNLKVCIDPGHYQTHNNNYALSNSSEKQYSYSEAKTMLAAAKELKATLAEYGVDSYMTRTSDNITLGGYSNATLDSNYITLRGDAAAKNNCDFFISLHTNANSANNKGNKTWAQQTSLNKTVVFINKTGKSNAVAVNVANTIGTQVTDVNYRYIGGSYIAFKTVSQNNIKNWTESYNDSLNVAGTVLYRAGSNGDYYGVLRGASSNNTPGVLVEHAYHTIPIVRYYCQGGQNNLYENWGVSDAVGILGGYGLIDANAYN